MLDDEVEADWVEIPASGGMPAKVRYSGLVARAVFDIPLEGIDSQVVGLTLGPLQDLLWVALPESRRTIQSVVENEIADALSHDRRVLSISSRTASWELWYELLQPNLAGLPATGRSLRDLFRVLRQVMELDTVLGHSYLDALREGVFERLVPDDPFGLSSFAPDLAMELASWATISPPRDPFAAPSRSLAVPFGAVGRGWLEVAVRPGRRVVCLRYGDIVSTAVFHVLPVDLNRRVMEFGLDPFADLLWELLPESRPVVQALVTQELRSAIDDDRALRSLPVVELCRELFRKVVRPALNGFPACVDVAVRSLNVVRHLLDLAVSLDGSRASVLRDEICDPLAHMPYRPVVAELDPTLLRRIQGFLDERRLGGQ